jgi:glycosyltransferase involved in cell wall biosynthesis
VLERLLARWTLRTANSSAVAENVACQFRIPRNEIVIVPNAVEIPERDVEADRQAVRAELGLSPNQTIVLMVGRQTPAKNYPMFYRVCRRVTEHRPDVLFVCAGHGELASELQRLRDEMSLGQTIRILGLRHDIPRLMAAADVFCLTSNWEGFPNAVLEAMASGLPVLVTRFAGVEHLIQERTGVLVDLDDDRQMARTLGELLDDADKRAQLGREARQHVQQQFSWSRLISTMSAIYTRIVDIAN